MSRKCSKCGFICDSDEFDFCPKCGQKMEMNSWICEACGVINPLDACFCIKCGQAKDKIAAPEKDNSLPTFQEEKNVVPDKINTTNKSESFMDANRKIISAVIIAVMLLGGFILYQNKHKFSSNHEKTSSVTSNEVYHSEEFKIKKLAMPLYFPKYRSFTVDEKKLSELKGIHDLYYKVPIYYQFLTSSADVVAFGKNESDSIKIISFPLNPAPDNEIGDCYLLDVNDLVKKFKDELKKHNESIFYIEDYSDTVKNDNMYFIHVIAFIANQDMIYKKVDLYMTYYKKYGYCIEISEGSDVFSQDPDRDESYNFLMSLKLK